jgi:phenylalanyl-tRNA synthetase beta chain
MRPARASRLLGYEVSRADAEGAFERLRMQHRVVEGSPEASAAAEVGAEVEVEVEVEVPGYRVDIEHEVDLIEEVARLLGYDRVGTHVPSTGQAGGAPAGYRFRQRAIEGLVRSGLSEVRLMTFASADDLAMTGQTDAVPVANPLQADERFLRTSLLPGLVHAAARNQAQGVTEVAIFEAGTVFRLDGEHVVEHQHAAFTLSGQAGEHWDARSRSFDALDATGALGSLMTDLGVHDWKLGDPPGPPFHPGRSATVLASGIAVGVVGELHPRVARDHDVVGRLAACELSLDALIAGIDQGSVIVRDLPRYPPVRRDLAFVLPEGVPAGDVLTGIEEAAGELFARCVLFDVYRGDPLPPGTKSLAFAVDLRAADRTLTGEETEPIVEAIVERLRSEFDAELRSG